MKATIKDRIVAHRSAPDVYDPPSFEQMADRIEELEERLKAAQDDAKEAEAYAEELEAKLAKAVEVAEKSIKWLRLYGADVHREAATLAELTGGNDE